MECFSLGVDKKKYIVRNLLSIILKRKCIISAVRIMLNAALSRSSSFLLLVIESRLYLQLQR